MKQLRPSAWSLAVKLPVIVCLVVAGVAAVIGIAVIGKDRSQLQEAQSEKAGLLARWVSAGVAEPMLRNDTWSIYRSLRQVVAGGIERQDEVVTAMVLDTDGIVLAHLHPSQNPIGLPFAVHDGDEMRMLVAALGTATPKVLFPRDGSFIEGLAPVFAGGKRIGVVRVRLSTIYLDRTMKESAAVILGLALGLAAVASLIGVGLSLGAVYPLRRLAEAMAFLGKGQHVRVPIPASGGDEIAQLGAVFNQMVDEVAEKQQLQRKLAQSEKTAALGRIAAGVAHEINNPLAGILNCVSTIKDHPDQPGLVERYLPVIERGLTRIRAIVQDLLVEQRAENASGPCEPACLDDLKELILAEMEGRRITLAWRNDVGPHVQVNRLRLQQAVLNLLKNAIQAMPNGGDLHFSAATCGTELRIQVADTGVGIPAEDTGRIFDPFFTSRKGGTGLGLWITWRLVEAMGGTIQVNSTVGQGTVFDISIPIREESDGPAEQ